MDVKQKNLSNSSEASEKGWGRPISVFGTTESGAIVSIPIEDVLAIVPDDPEEEDE